METTAGRKRYSQRSMTRGAVFLAPSIHLLGAGHPPSPLLSVPVVLGDVLLRSTRCVFSGALHNRKHPARLLLQTSHISIQRAGGRANEGTRVWKVPRCLERPLLTLPRLSPSSDSETRVLLHVKPLLSLPKDGGKLKFIFKRLWIFYVRKILK